MTRTNNTSRPIPSLSGKRLDVPLKKLVSDPLNARRTRPDVDAHRRLVATIRSCGLLEPLVVRQDNGGQYQVIAGRRRLRALREIFKGQNPKVPCTLKPVHGDAAGAVSLAENFAREPMHPLDEAEEFARLAKNDGKGAEDIAAQFGVLPKYIRQRMKLSALADVVKAAYREGRIDTATAEVFSAVPASRQAELWDELKGTPRNAQHVQSLIDHAWIDASHALFDVATLPESTVSWDLFAERVLVERKAFMEKQAEALLAQQKAMQEEGWKEVVVGSHSDIQDRLYAMEEATVEYDKETTAALVKLDQKREKLEQQLDETDADTDMKRAEALQKKLDDLEAEGDAMLQKAEGYYGEATKSLATAFLVLDPEGRVERRYRVPRTRGKGSGTEVTSTNGADGHPTQAPKPPTPSDLSDRQKATLFAHQSLMVRKALLDNPLVCKRVLVMILHEKVRSQALAVRHDSNGTTLHAMNSEGVNSDAFGFIRANRKKLDPQLRETHTQDAYAKLSKLAEEKLDGLMGVLTVELLTAHALRPTPLVALLADELKVNIRQGWTPDERWLEGYTKLQLSDLLGTFRGPAYGENALRAKKSELVDHAAKLFADAAEGKLTDAALAKRVNEWLPEGVLKELTPTKLHRKHAE